MNKEVLIVFAILALCLIYALAAVPTRADAAATAYRVDSEPPAAEPIMTCEEKTKVCYELSEEERAIVESSEWHESQTYVCTIGGHRFFEEAGK